MTRRASAAVIGALVAAVGLVALYAALGGTTFRTMRVASACSAQPAPRPGADLDQLAQALALTATRSAACDLGVTREELILALPSPPGRAALLRRHGRTEQDLQTAYSTGFTEAIDQLDAAGSLPSSSELLDAYKDQLGLPGAAVGLIDAVPADVVDQFLPVREILRDAAAGLDPAVFSRSPDELQRAITDAVAAATVARAKDALAKQVPMLQGLLG